MFECVNCFLGSQLLPVQHIIEGSPNPSVFKETKDSLVKYLIDKLVEDHQCLFLARCFLQFWMKELAKTFPVSP